MKVWFGSSEFKKEAAERLQGLFPQVAEWQESIDATVGDQTVDVLVRFQMGQGQETKTLICEARTRGEPRHLREAVTRLRELRLPCPGGLSDRGCSLRDSPSRPLLRRNDCGYLDLAGNCYLAFDNVLIQKEGRPNIGAGPPPTQDPLRPPGDAGRCGPSWWSGTGPGGWTNWAGRVGVSLGHAHNVIKRLEGLDWVERGRDGLYRLPRPGELLDAWRDAYSYRVNGLSAFVSSGGRQAPGHGGPHPARDRAGHELRVHRFTPGTSLIGPHTRVSAVHCYVSGDTEALARVLGLQPVEGEGSVYLMAPYDPGVFYAPVIKGGFRVVSLPQLYVDLYGHERRGREQAEKLRRDAMGF